MTNGDAGSSGIAGNSGMPGGAAPNAGAVNGGRHVTKHIFVTGGVASSLGKGATASSLGRLLKMRGLRVT
ncbi:MAG: hypothetical protein AB7H43_14755, partial [Acidimicrobiia bacterium]